MKINSKELHNRYGIELPSGKYDITNDGEYYTISTVKDDTEGCILVGTENLKNDDNWIGNSREALAILVEKLREATDEITIEIV